MGAGKKAVIFGIGDFARVACFYFRHDSPIDVAAFTVDEQFLTRRNLMDLPVIPWEDLTKTHPPSDFALFVAVGYSRVNKNREEVFYRAKAAGYEMITYVCSKATTWSDLTVGEGSFIFENNVIQPFVKIGANTVLWSGNHVGHDSIVGDHVFITSHVVISGNCRIGNNTFIGVNATLRDGISIGEDCVVGAGTVIMKDAAAGSVFKATSTPPATLTSDQLRRI